MTNISLPLSEPIGSPTFHSSGDRMLVIKGHYNSDVLHVPLSRISNGETNQRNASKGFNAINRSNLGEDLAIFQPNGNLIAYQSDRSGEEQVWLTDGSSSRQLSHFPMDTYFVGMNWAADGQSLLVNVVHELSQVYLDGSVKRFPLRHAVEKLFYFDSDNQTALMNMRVNGIPKFVELDLSNSNFRIINEKKVNWAVKSESGQIVYTDHMDRFWQPGPAEDLLIDAIKEEGSNKRFLVHNDVIYGVNEGFQLWSYSLVDEKFRIIGDLPKNIDYLTDISNEELLISVRVSGRKEVAEIILAD